MSKCSSERFTLLRQAVLLTLVSISAVGPLLWQRGIDVVTRTYSMAVTRLWSGEDLYLPAVAGADLFKYSPAFAFFYTPLAGMESSVQALIWAVLNAFVFWLGVSVWLRVPGKRWSVLWLFWIATSMELDISLRYQQFNACLAGLALLGVWAFRNRLRGWAGVCLGIAAQTKLLPGVFAIALLFPPRRRYFVALCLSVGLLSLIPFCLRGLDGGVSLYRSWENLLMADMHSSGLMDVASSFARVGWPVFGLVAKKVVLLVTVILFAANRFQRMTYDLRLWLGLGMSALLLLSPRTESPTFVLVAPLILLCAALYPDRKSRMVLGLVFFGMTVVYTDLWPKRIWDPRDSYYLSKVGAVFIFWGWAVREVLGSWRQSIRPSRAELAENPSSAV